MFKICVVGCGGLSTAVHGPSFKKYAEEIPNVALAACCDLDSQKANTYQKLFGFKRHYNDIDIMLDTEKPAAVCLFVPVNLTAKLAVKIISKGFPLLMEKPPGIDAAECRFIIDAASINDVPVQVAFNRRYMPLTRTMKQHLTKYSPKEIQYIKYDFERYNRTDKDFATTAIHAIDAVRFLAGSDFREININYRKLPGLKAKNIHMYAIMESGANALLNFSPCVGRDYENCEVGLKDRNYCLELARGDFPGSFRIFEKLSLVEEILPNPAPRFISSGFYGENQQFFDDLRLHGQITEGGVENSLQSVDIADFLRKNKDKYLNTERKITCAAKLTTAVNQ